MAEGEQGAGFPAVASASGWRGHAVPVALLALLTVVVLWPAVKGFTEDAAADSVDAAMFSWLWRIIPDSLAQLENPFRTDLVFHPIGADLELTTTSPLLALLLWPVGALLGTAAQVNALQLLSMFGTGLAMYALAHRITSHRPAALLAGMAYSLLPNRFVHVDGHLNLVATGVIPLGLLLLLRFAEQPGNRRAVELGLVCGCSFLIDPQLAILLLLGVGAWLVRHLSVVRSSFRQLLLALGVAALAAAPLAIPMVFAMARGGIGDPDPTGSTIQYSSSPLSWVVPPTDRLLLGRAFTVEPLTPNWEGVAYPGLALLGLAVAGVSYSSASARRGWVAMAMTGFVLSLGPHPFVRNAYVPVPLPFFAVREVPGLDAMRVPGRFALLGAVAVHALAAIAVADLVRRLTRRRAKVLVLLAGAVTLLELYPGSITVRDDGVPEAYRALAADTSQLAVLELPLKWSTTQEQYGFAGTGQDFRFLLYQLEHGHPIVSGAVSRYPSANLETLVDTPLYRQVLALSDQPGFTDLATFDRRTLESEGIGFIVYHRDDPVPGALAYVESLGLDVLVDDGTTIIWKV